MEISHIVALCCFLSFLIVILVALGAIFFAVFYIQRNSRRRNRVTRVKDDSIKKEAMYWEILNMNRAVMITELRNMVNMNSFTNMDTKDTKDTDTKDTKRNLSSKKLKISGHHNTCNINSPCDCGNSITHRKNESHYYQPDDNSDYNKNSDSSNFVTETFSTYFDEEDNIHE